MQQTFKSRNALVEATKRYSGCDKDVLSHAPVFQTGTREEMLRYAGQTALNSPTHSSALHDAPKNEPQIRLREK